MLDEITIKQIRERVERDKDNQVSTDRTLLFYEREELLEIIEALKKQIIDMDDYINLIY